jgi:hypothetical protein
MRKLPPIVSHRLIPARLCLPLLCLPLFLTAQFSPAQTQPRENESRQVSVQQVRVLGGKDAVEIEVEASDRIVPQAQMLTDPDRLVVDFPNAVPGPSLRSQSVEQGEVKDVRFGLFQNNPPVTRLVLDLKSAQSYQVFPGRTVIIKVSGGAGDASNAAHNFAPAPATRPGYVVANYTTGAERIRVETPVRSSIQPVESQVQPQVKPQPQIKPLDVSFRNGQLSIHADKATLSEVLFAVQQRTGADIGIVAGAEQERVVVDLGPAPAPEVLAQLLNGSKFNFLIVSAPNDPHKLDRVILSPRAEGLVVSRAPISSPPPQPTITASDDDDEASRPAPPPPPGASRPPIPGGPAQPDIHPEVNVPANDIQPQ